MVKLTPASQQEFVRRSSAFKPAAGKWGLNGATIVTLADADENDIREALAEAWTNVSGR